MDATKAQAMQAIRDMEPFISAGQRLSILHAMEGEERQFFYDLMVAHADRIRTMPGYRTMENPYDEVAVLHYFHGGCDWYITQKDADPDKNGQVWAFGYANLGDPQYAELGYISIKELLESGVELDLYWTPKPLSEIKQSMGV